MLRSKVRFFPAPPEKPWSEGVRLRATSGASDSIAHPSHARSGSIARGDAEETTDRSRGNLALHILTSRYRAIVTKQTTVRLPEELAEDAETVARVKGTSLNQLIVDSLAAEIDRARADEDFTSRAKRLLARDKELLDRLVR